MESVFQEFHRRINLHARNAQKLFQMTKGNVPSTDWFIETIQDQREALNPLNFEVSEDRSLFIFSCANLPSEIIGQFFQILDGIIYIGFIS